MATGRKKESKHLKHKLKWIRINFEQIELKCFYGGRTKNKRYYFFESNLSIDSFVCNILRVLSWANPFNEIRKSDFWQFNNEIEFIKCFCSWNHKFWQNFVSFRHSGKSEPKFIQRNSKSISLKSAWYVYNSFPLNKNLSTIHILHFMVRSSYLGPCCGTTFAISYLEPQRTN